MTDGEERPSDARGEQDRSRADGGIGRRVDRIPALVATWFKEVGTALGHLWRRSLQLRVIVSTLTLSLIVITILGGWC